MADEERNPATEAQSAQADSAPAESAGPLERQAAERMAFEKVMQGLRQRQNLTLGILGGLAGAVVGGVLWAWITIYLMAHMGLLAPGLTALAVGVLVGWPIRWFGRGYTPVFGAAGAVLSVLGCLLGSVLTAVAINARSYEVPFFEALGRVDFKFIVSILKQPLQLNDPMGIVTLLFYVIAAYAGYHLSIRRVSNKDLAAVMREKAK